MIARILVALSGTDYTPFAIQSAIDLAQHSAARLTGVTVFDAEKLRRIGPVPIGAGGLANELRNHRIAEMRQHVEEVVSQFTASCQEAGVSGTVFREESEEMFDYLISESRYHDLTVMGLKGMLDFHQEDNDADRTALLIRLISMGVRPILAVPKHPFSVRRVMIAYSGSVESAKTMKRFVQLRPWGDAPIEARIVTFEHSREKGERLLQSAAVYCRAHGLQTETAFIDAPAKEALLPEAEESGADLIVLGNSAGSILFRRMMGETCLRAIQQSDKPLFLCQ